MILNLFFFFFVSRMTSLIGIFETKDVRLPFRSHEQRSFFFFLPNENCCVITVKSKSIFLQSRSGKFTIHHKPMPSNLELKETGDNKGEI